MAESQELRIRVYFQDEWPSRIAKFISDISKWLSAHPDFTKVSADDITSHLLDVFESKCLVHGLSLLPVNCDATNGADHTFDCAVVFDDLRSTIALAAFERYGRCDLVAISH